MMTASIIWLILNTLTLTMLMIWVGAMDPSTHLPHWSDHRFYFYKNLPLFFSLSSAMLVLGPISILFLWRLKQQVKAYAQKERQMDILWGPNISCKLESTIPLSIT